MKRGEMKKVHTKWRLEEELVINKMEYGLKGVILHIGVNVTYGHYIMVGNGSKYDDELVGQMEYSEIPPEQIYMLFYCKK